MAQCVNRVIDQGAAVIEWHYPHTLRQAGLHLGQLLFDRLDDFERIGAVTNHNDATDSLFATIVEYASAKLRTELHRRDVTNVDRRAIGSGEDDVLDVVHSA